MRTTLRTLLLALTALVALGGAALAGPAQPPVTKALAEALALQVVPGTVVESELEKERGRRVYSIEIRTADGAEAEVLIAADDGSTVAVEADDEADDEDDGDDD